MKTEENDNELLDLTIKKLAGEAGEAETLRLDKLLSEKKENQKLYDEIVQTWIASEKAKGITEDDTQEEWVRLKMAISQSQKSSAKSFPLLRIAASIALLLAVGWSAYLFLKEDHTQIIAQQVQTEKLEDGSTVTLNAGSELSYKLTEKTREVKLSGEAYFEVKKDPVKPFIIHTSSIDVEVLGTAFNVRSKETALTTEVTVTSGLVAVSYQNKVIKLESGEKGVLNRQSGQLFKLVNSDPNYLSWKTKKFTFDDQPLSKVIDVLNNAFQSNIYLDSKDLADCPITVSFEDQTLEEILKILKATLGLSIQNTTKGIQLNGPGC